MSHGSGDTWIARQMARCIGEAGAETFVDAYDLDVGDQFEAQILQALGGCDELVALITPFALKRAWVHQEAGSMLHQGKRVSVVLYGISLQDVAIGSGPDLGVLRNRTLIELNNFDIYLSQLRERCGRAR